MVNNSAILFCELVLVLFLGALAGAVILRLSCVLFNLFAGVSGKQIATTAAWLSRHARKTEADWALYDRVTTFKGVPRPGYDRAVLIVFFATLINVPGTFVAFRLLRLAGQVNGALYSDFLPIACIALPMGILVLAGLNTAMLPTSLRKGLWISLLCHLLAAILVSVLVLIVMTFGLHDFLKFPFEKP